ncbi:phosphoglycerate mutase family protein [Hyphomonas neptunium ATCC 15444]|uniref:Phosphoglycerate mutase family protein n=2 Tax=Hyphomonas TaxID=85 RepID=Q0BXB8_HYPNA|nr:MULTISPECIES: phosphoglycerate mutase family protein [Hyphomonas]ABI75782.1 phosphoglycerate mutase family protein [Hyphomonas neptunium ATCC 15444]KCZ86929.1 phosphoglycerate mutase family protein [Hyphomonas hirschiana VP5]
MAAHLIRRSFVFFLAASVLAACSTPVAPVSGAEDVTRIFLVRHAEKEKGPDPALSAAGVSRAQLLSERLGEEGVTEIWSTATRRTEETARPLAEALSLPVQIYDPAAMPAFAKTLTGSPGVKLVVGHSNTTDALAALIGADPGPPIDEAGEFDRLYVISLEDDLTIKSRIERYGAAAAKRDAGAP